MLIESLIKELEEKLDQAKSDRGEFMIGLSWIDSEGEIQHYFMQHHFSKEDTDMAWVEIRKLIENAV